MTTIHTTAQVAPDGTLILTHPTNLAPGVHRAVIVLDDERLTAASRQQLDLPEHDFPWPDEMSLRREDMYGDDAR